MSLEGFSLISKGWCCVGPDLYLSLLPESAGSLWHVPRPSDPCLSCSCPLTQMPGILPGLGFVPSELSLQLHPTPETGHEGGEIAFAHIWTPLGLFLRITAGSHCPHKAPSKTLQAASPFPNTLTQQCSHLSSLLDQATGPTLSSPASQSNVSLPGTAGNGHPIEHSLGMEAGE